MYIYNIYVSTALYHRRKIIIVAPELPLFQSRFITRVRVRNTAFQFSAEILGGIRACGRCRNTSGNCRLRVSSTSASKKDICSSSRSRWRRNKIEEGGGVRPATAVRKLYRPIGVNNLETARHSVERESERETLVSQNCRVMIWWFWQFTWLREYKETRW